jgi:hypothetical protein
LRLWLFQDDFWARRRLHSLCAPSLVCIYRNVEGPKDSSFPIFLSLTLEYSIPKAMEHMATGSFLVSVHWC